MPESLRVLAEAREELEEATAWYTERSRQAAAAFVADFRAAIDRIRRMPLTWPEDAAGTRRVLLQRYPYKIVYRVAEQQQIVVIAVAHQKRSPGYFRHR